MPTDFAVLGAGAWGTAAALIFSSLLSSLKRIAPLRSSANCATRAMACESGGVSGSVMGSI